MKYISAAAILSVVLAGCMSSGIRVSQEQAAQFTEGHTTRSEVIATLGNPTTTTRNPDGTITIHYSYVEATARPTSYIPIVGLFAGGADSTANLVTMRFDRDDKLIDYSTSTSQQGSNMFGSVDSVPNQPRKD